LLLFRSYAAVLHDAEIAMLLAVLLPHLGAEKHGGGQNGRNLVGWEEGRSALHAVPRLWITSRVADKILATIPARNVRAGWTLLRKSGWQPLCVRGGTPLRRVVLRGLRLTQ